MRSDLLACPFPTHRAAEPEACHFPIGRTHSINLNEGKLPPALAIQAADRQRMLMFVELARGIQSHRPVPRSVDQNNRSLKLA